MAKVRSPNYPSMPLDTAIEAVRPVYDAEHRNKMSRAVLARHMGYTSLNGRALTKIGAVRAYGLLDGSGDELRVSDDAVDALMAPGGSATRSEALLRIALRPALFQELRKQFPDRLPSLENVKFALIKRHFTEDAAEKAATAFLSTMSLVSGIPDNYNPPPNEEADVQDAKSAKTPEFSKKQQGAVKLMDGERVVFTEEGQPSQYLKLIASGEVDAVLLEALEDFVKRQKKRLQSAKEFAQTEASGSVSQPLGPAFRR